MVGSFTGSPVRQLLFVSLIFQEITLLCIGNMASVFVNFIYQITFFTSIMAIVGQFEIRNEMKNLSKPRKLSITIGEMNGINVVFS